jgi:hypothetical protein
VRPRGAFLQAPRLRRVGSALVSIAAFGIQPSAGKPRRSLLLGDCYRLVSVGDPVMSPDGRQIAFVRTPAGAGERYARRDPARAC